MKRIDWALREILPRQRSLPEPERDSLNYIEWQIIEWQINDKRTNPVRDPNSGADNRRSAMNRKKLDKSNLLQFKRRLEASRDDAYRFLDKADRENRALDRGDPQDLGDLCVSDLSQDLLFQRCSQQRQVLNMVEEALRRIDDNTFGQCIGCGDHINGKRLEAMPWTRYCLPCQEERERLQRIKLRTRHFSGIQAHL